MGSKVEEEDGSSVNRSFWVDSAAFDLPAPVWYSGDSEREVSNCEERADTEDVKFAVRSRLAWMFFVLISRVSLKFAATSVILFWRRRTTFLLCWPSWSCGLGWRV